MTSWTEQIRPVVRPAVLTGQHNGQLDADILMTSLGLAGGPPVRLVAPAHRAWNALTAAALAAGHTLKATSAADSYRELARQQWTFNDRYQRGTDGPGDRQCPPSSGVWWSKKRRADGTYPASAACPGYSNHGLGLAVDCGEERDTDPAAESLDAATLGWLEDHAWDFGWSWEVAPEEPWHIRYCTGDAIPAAVLAYEASVNPPPPPPEPPEEDVPTARFVRKTDHNAWWRVGDVGRTWQVSDPNSPYVQQRLRELGITDFKIEVIESWVDLDSAYGPDLTPVGFTRDGLTAPIGDV